MASTEAARAREGGGEAAGQEAAPPRVRAWLLARLAVPATGVLAATVYGMGVERLRAGPPLVMLALGGLALALCALAVWRSVDPLLRPAAAADPAPRQAPAHLRELEREKQAVLKAIKEIELDHQMRKIAHADYREMVERYRARAMRLIAALDAGGAGDYRELIERELKERLARLDPDGGAGAGAASEAAAAGRSCGACGAGNDGDALFCKRCGTRFEAAAPA